MLADLGADVIKIEPPEGDITRYAYPRVNSLSTYFIQQNVGKRAVSVDMKRPEAVDLLHRLATRADVVLENFRPGVMDRMGLGYDAMSAVNERLVYASITGFGQTGPWHHRRAYAAVIQAESGFTKSQTDGHRRQSPELAYVNDEHSHADVYTALEASTAILAALFRRSVTGRGQHIDISMLETMLMVNEHVQDQLWERPVPAGYVRSYQPGDYIILTVADGSSVTVAGHPCEAGTFERFAEAMGRPNLAAEDVRYADPPTRFAHLRELFAEIHAWAATCPDSASIEATFAANHIAMGVLRTVREVAESDWAHERHAVLAVTDRGDGTVDIPNAPWTFSADEAGARGIPKYRGEDNREVFGEMLGLAGDELDRLETAGVLISRMPKPR